MSRPAQHHLQQTARCSHGDGAQRGDSGVTVDAKKKMISSVCKWQLKDTWCCRRCPCSLLIGTIPAAEWPLTLICQKEAGGSTNVALQIKSMTWTGKGDGTVTTATHTDARRFSAHTKKKRIWMLVAKSYSQRAEPREETQTNDRRRLTSSAESSISRFIRSQRALGVTEGGGGCSGHLIHIDWPLETV